MTTYQDLKAEKDPTLSYTEYNFNLYKDKGRELEFCYRLGHEHGLNARPRFDFVDMLTDAQRKAYVHGFFTGEYEALHVND